MGRDSSVGTVTVYGLESTEIEPRRRRDFCNRPDPPWGPPSDLHNGCRVSFPGVKRPWLWHWAPTPTSADVKERVEHFLAGFRANFTFTWFHILTGKPRQLITHKKFWFTQTIHFKGQSCSRVVVTGCATQKTLKSVTLAYVFSGTKLLRTFIILNGFVSVG